MVNAVLHYHRQQFGAAKAFSGILTSLLTFAMLNGMGQLIVDLGEARMWQIMCLPGGYPATVELGDGSLFSVYYQKAAANEHCSLLWSRWELPA